MATKSSAEQIREYVGPAVLSFGFRPFFLLAGFWAVVVIALFLPMLAGHIELPTVFSPVEWHVHELLFGYLAAVVAGFLLTAVPNWTGRLPVVGTPLLFLVILWLAGRLAVLTSSWIGAVAAAGIDMAFLVALGFVIAREIIAGRNTRNLKVLVVVSLLVVANGLFHFEAMVGGDVGYGIRLGVAAAVFLIMLIGGRIIPSFTRNWLVKGAPGRLPKAFDRFDVVVLAVSGVALLLWIIAPERSVSALALLIAALVNFLRMARWAGERTFAEPLVTILHIAYAFIPIGFALVALAALRPDVIAPAGAMHGWTAGGIGLMTLAVMTRASLGHTGQRLTAEAPIIAIYAAAIIAALARIAAAFGLEQQAMLYVAALAWIAAFSGFLIVYVPLLARRSA
mgnify:CR=1 FL=1